MRQCTAFAQCTAEGPYTTNSRIVHLPFLPTETPTSIAPLDHRPKLARTASTPVDLHFPPRTRSDPYLRIGPEVARTRGAKSTP